jgi:hypothetical protein
LGHAIEQPLVAQSGIAEISSRLIGKLEGDPESAFYLKFRAFPGRDGFTEALWI